MQLTVCRLSESIYTLILFCCNIYQVCLTLAPSFWLQQLPKNPAFSCLLQQSQSSHQNSALSAQLLQLATPSPCCNVYQSSLLVSVATITKLASVLSDQLLQLFCCNLLYLPLPVAAPSHWQARFKFSIQLLPVQLSHCNLILYLFIYLLQQLEVPSLPYPVATVTKLASALSAQHLAVVLVATYCDFGTSPLCSCWLFASALSA